MNAEQRMRRELKRIETDAREMGGDRRPDGKALEIVARILSVAETCPRCGKSGECPCP